MLAKSKFENIIDRDSLECQMFYWNEFYEQEQGVFVFGDVKLKIDVNNFGRNNVGIFKAGHKFQRAVLDTVHSSVEFFDKEDSQSGHKYAIYLFLGERL